jgi:hypothetical protein
MTYIANPAAQAQAAHHRTALLLDRCRAGQPAPASAQTLWYKYQQTLFLAWLDAGGFAHTQTEQENSGTEPLFSVPQKDLEEESQFTLVRIDDAVE